MKTQLIVVGTIAVIGLYLISSSVVIVNSGHVGVVRTLGAVQMTQLDEGCLLRFDGLEVEQRDSRASGHLG